MTGHDTRLRLSPSNLPASFKIFVVKVVQNKRKVDRGTCFHAGSVIALAEVTSDKEVARLTASEAIRSKMLLMMMTTKNSEASEVTTTRLVAAIKRSTIRISYDRDLTGSGSSTPLLAPSMT